MLFHSIEFLFYFLPTVFIGWWILQLCHSSKAALLWLTISSLVFYGYWNPPYVTLLISSILANFFLGKIVDPQSGRSQQTRFFVLSIGVIGNLFLLGYFKYFNFLFLRLMMFSNLDGISRKLFCHWPSAFSLFSRSPTWWILTGAKQMSILF
jgi:alginate O-acetyltransferase complex protein AlgI